MTLVRFKVYRRGKCWQFCDVWDGDFLWSRHHWSPT